MIQINNLTKKFGKKLVLNQLNLTIEDNCVFGLIGINGAGKSTLLRILANVYDQTEGNVYYDGCSNQDIAVKQNIFFLPDDPHFTENTKIKDVIEFYQTFYDFDLKAFNEYLEAFKLQQNNQNIFDQAINKFSKGMKRQLYICVALAIAPKYLLLDEAFDGLDPLARLTFKKLILKKMEENTMTIIISSHSLRELEDICDCFGLLNNGQIESSGSIEDNLNNYHKYQIAFNHPIAIEELKEHLNIVSINQIGKIYHLVCIGNENEIRTYLESFNPLLLDQVTIDFEELFVLKVEKEGENKNEK